MTEETNRQSDGSPRSFVKKGALATTALGAVTAAGTVSAQEEEEVLVYGKDYRPDVNFDVVSQLTTPTKRDLIDASGAADTVFDDPDDWDAFLINYDVGSDAPTWAILLTEHVDLSAGDSETMGEESDFRDPQLDLIEVTL